MLRQPGPPVGDHQHDGRRVGGQVGRDDREGRAGKTTSSEDGRTGAWGWVAYAVDTEGNPVRRLRDGLERRLTPVIGDSGPRSRIRERGLFLCFGLADASDRTSPGGWCRRETG